MQCANPFAFGSGFIVEYNNDCFFVTADHVLHLDDYKDDNNVRTGNDYVISIFNNVTPENNFLSTIVTPLGGFYYMESFNLDKPKDVDELIDITLCKMKPINFQYPFLTDEVRFTNETIAKGQLKLKIKEECFAEPKQQRNYFIFGKINADIRDDIRMERDSTLKESLQYMSKTKDYFLFNTTDIIYDSNDWEGLSGSPVISEDGECVGVLCSVNENSQSVWVVPIAQVKRLLDIAIRQEEIEQ